MLPIDPDTRPWFLRDGDLQENWLDMMMPTMKRGDPLRPKMSYSEDTELLSAEIERLIRIAELTRRLFDLPLFRLFYWPYLRLRDDSVRDLIDELQQLLDSKYGR